MYVPWWAFVGLAGVFLVRAWWRHHFLKHEVGMVRAWWDRLPRQRRQEILYVRERLHLNGDRYMLDYSRLSDEELQQGFENSLQNSPDGDTWAFELLKEQVLGHASDEGLMRSAAPTDRA